MMRELTDQVVETVMSIPPGKVMTYGNVAREARTGARVVGRVLHDWHLAPGLRQKDGRAFIGAFLFETPFVRLRIDGPVQLVAACFGRPATVAHQWRPYRRAIAGAEAPAG
jgi:hypothetical protein